MAKNTNGDFGLPRRPIARSQVVGIFDLVGFTNLDSNKDLLHAVRTMETQLELVFEREEFFWGDLDRKCIEMTRNTLLLSSTGDGYVVAFSGSAIQDFAALQVLTEIHCGIRRHSPVRLGVNRGENYVVKDLNVRANIIGWGVNLAARALAFAQDNQIICTQYLAGALLETRGELSESLEDIGERRVKNTDLHLYNYYKENEFGSALVDSQRSVPG